MSAPEPPSLPPRRSEILWAALVGLLLGVLLVGRPVWDSDLVYLASDTATVQAPWSVPAPPANRQLSDSAVAFYPHYRHLSASWRAGEVPLWNPGIYAGVPLLANAQWGALDPQVLALVLLESVGGRTLFDMGFAWLAVLRLGLAFLGTYWLARRLGLAWLPAAFGGVGFALSGSNTLWLGFSLSHVTPLLPWVLLGVEGFRWESSSRSAFALTAIGLALAIYGGHPEVAFFVGLAAGVWSLSLWSRSPRSCLLALAALAVGVLLAAPMLMPFVEYLQNSGALLAHRMAPNPRRLPDLLSVGSVLILVGFVWRWRGLGREEGEGAGGLGAGLRCASLVLAVGGWWLLSFGQGALLDPALAPVESIESGSSRLPLVVLLFALIALFGGGRQLPRSRWIVALAILPWMLSIGIPGVVDLWRWIPLVGLAAPQRAACVGALFLSLLGASGLAGLRARGLSGLRGAQLRVVVVSAVLSLVSLALVVELRGREPALDPQLAGLDSSDEILEFRALPSAATSAANNPLAGVLRGGVDVDEMSLGFERLGDRGQLLEESKFRRVIPLAPREGAEEQPFYFGPLDLRPLGPGAWRLRLDFLVDGEPIAKRNAALVQVRRPKSWSWIGLVILGLSSLVILGASTPWSQGLLLGLCLWSGLFGVWGWNPGLPKSRHFAPTRTAELLSTRFVGERFFSDPGIFPGSTGLLTAAQTIDGYDAMDVASFDGYRAYALKPGRNPLLDWNLHGANLESAAFRLFGVRVLLALSPRQLDGWDLIAGPRLAPELAEVFVYEARQPLARAFCVPEIRSRESILSGLQSFDPRDAAFLEEGHGFELEEPFEHSRVRRLRETDVLQEFEVELDGEGLFLSTEQHFPGWRLTVNGEARDILRTNSIFRGVYLGAGTHHLRFEYAPSSWRVGKWLGALGLLLLVLGLGFARRR